MPNISSAIARWVQPAHRNPAPIPQQDRPLEVAADAHQDDFNGWSDLHFAAHNNKPWLFAELATPEAVDTIDALGRTPLHIAARAGHFGAVFHLIKRGADVDAPDFNGWTAAHYAAVAGHTDVIKVLFNEHANLDAEAADQTRPLDLAYREDRFETMQILSESGATISEGDDVFLGPNSHLRRPK